MTKAKTQPTARERYRQIRQKQTQTLLEAPVAENETLYDFTAPSGMEFKLRKIDMSILVNMGALPTGLASRVDMGSPEAAFNSLSDEKKAVVIEQSANIVRYICVNPRIVDDPQSDDEIGPDDVMMSDFTALVEWAGGGALRLKTFRGKR